MHTETHAKRWRRGMTRGLTLGTVAATALATLMIAPAAQAADASLDNPKAPSAAHGQALALDGLNLPLLGAAGSTSEFGGKVGGLAGLDLSVLGEDIKLGTVTLPLLKDPANPASEGLLDLGDASLLRGYSEAGKKTSAVASSGVITDEGGLNLADAPNDELNSARVDLTALLAQLGLSGITDGIIDELSLELGAVGARVEKTDEKLTSEYAVAGLKANVGAPLVGGLTTGLDGVVSTVGGLLDGLVGDGGLVDGVLGALKGVLNVNLLVLSLESKDVRAEINGLDTLVENVLDELVRTPVQNSTGSVYVNLAEGTVTLDLAELAVEGNGYTDLNGLPANTNLLNDKTLTAVTAGLTEALIGTADNPNSLISKLTAILTDHLWNSVSIDIFINAKVKALLGILPIADTTVQLTGTLAEFAGYDGAKLGNDNVVFELDLLGILPIGKLIEPIVKPLLNVVGQSLTGPLLTMLTKDVIGGLQPLVQGVLEGVLSPLLKTLEPVLEEIATVTINEQTKPGKSGDLGAGSHTTNALAVKVLPGVLGENAVSLEIGNASVKAADIVTELSVSPSSVKQGGKVSITGSGYGATENVTVKSALGADKTVPTNADGVFTTEWTVPAKQATGSVKFTATGITSKRSATATVTVESADTGTNAGTNSDAATNANGTASSATNANASASASAAADGQATAAAQAAANADATTTASAKAAANAQAAAKAAAMTNASTNASTTAEASSKASAQAAANSTNDSDSNSVGTAQAEGNASVAAKAAAIADASSNASSKASADANVNASASASADGQATAAAQAAAMADATATASAKATANAQAAAKAAATTNSSTNASAKAEAASKASAQAAAHSKNDSDSNAEGTAKAESNASAAAKAAANQDASSNASAKATANANASASASAAADGQATAAAQAAANANASTRASAKATATAQAAAKAAALVDASTDASTKADAASKASAQAATNSKSDSDSNAEGTTKAEGNASVAAKAAAISDASSNASTKASADADANGAGAKASATASANANGAGAKADVNASASAAADSNANAAAKASAKADATSTASAKATAAANAAAKAAADPTASTGASTKANASAKAAAQAAANHKSDSDTNAKASAKANSNASAAAKAAAIADASSDASGNNPNPNTSKCITPNPKAAFLDTPTSHKFYTEIDWMYCMKYTTGIKSDAGLIYGPQMRLSREAMAAFIFRMQADPKYKAPKVSPFADMKPGDKFYREIAWMYEEGLSTGIKQASGKPIYGPKMRLTREAMAAFIYRLEAPNYTAFPPSKMQDMKPGDKFYTEISWMVDEGLSTGIRVENGDREYWPKSKLSREAMAAFIYRLVNDYRA